MSSEDDIDATVAAIDPAITATDKDGWMTIGWVLVRKSWHPDCKPGEAGFSYYPAPGQTIDTTRGILVMATTHYDEATRRA